MKGVIFFFLIIPFLSFSQDHQQQHLGEIRRKLEKLNFLGSVLYVAAHPDDENTRIIAYLSKGRLAETAYLSMTRGDGGQNLIGPEIRDQLGVIRTQELLGARRIDGGTQYFTRANDFGYSKSADETFNVWGKEEVLSDVVRVYRKFKPDVIITRFPPDERAGHGHHTASAILAREAFEKSAQPGVYPEQVKLYGAWQPRRLYTNTGRWWNNSINENTPGVLVMNVGGYSALLGRSYTEIAAVSRSQHKSQGFGTTGTRGDQVEYLEFEIGEPSTKDIFEGINTTWGRVKGGAKVQVLINKALAMLDSNPQAIVPMLLQIRKAILSLEPGVWRSRKLQEIEDLIQQCLGLFVEVTASEYWISPGSSVEVDLEIVNRSAVEVELVDVQSKDVSFDSVFHLPLKPNIPALLDFKVSLSEDKDYSSPYWLKHAHGVGMFTVNDTSLIGLPRQKPPVNFSLKLLVNGEQIVIERPLIYKWNSPVDGELKRPFEVVPPVFVNLSEPVLVFNTSDPKQASIVIKSSSSELVKGVVKLVAPDKWRIVPDSITFEMSRLGEEMVKTFQIFPSDSEGDVLLRAEAHIGEGKYDKSVQVIQYDHIPTQTLLPEATTKLVRVDLKKGGKTIGYIKGAGDDVPASIRNMGYSVWEMKNEEVTPENLKQLDAVVLGIRALNTNERIAFMVKDLLQYVHDGGNLIVQYNTSHQLLTDVFSPYPLTLSRDRVTDENSKVVIVNPNHPVVNIPNKITEKDFEGWVQERGLYFPNEWDSNFETVLAMNDAGQEPVEGSLLVARYGSGYYVYTGLSFFRELPEGVAGAYKLFANLISLGKEPSPNSSIGEKKRNGKKVKR